MEDLVFEKKVTFIVNVEKLLEEGIEYAKECEGIIKGADIPWGDIMFASQTFYDNGYFNLESTNLSDLEQKVCEVLTKKYDETMGY